MERKPILLLVEDEQDIRAINEAHLAGEGYEVVTARTLAQARAILWDHPPDLVLLDVRLPDGSGFDFSEEVRRISTAPIIFLTCLSEEEHMVRGLLAGGDDYMTKPYSLKVLSARVLAALRRNGLGGVGRIELPPLIIDLQAGRAELSGREIPLSPKELQLLAFFASNAGRAFTVEELYAAVWDGAPGLSSNTVRMHISNLRHKLHMDDAGTFEIALTADKRYRFMRVRFSAEG